MEAKAPLGYGGQGFSLKGEKGRFVLPPEFRKSVTAASEGQNKLCLLKHDRWQCLVGFGTLSVHSFVELVRREEKRHAKDAPAPFDRDKRLGDLWTYKTVPFDDSGRFLIPEGLVITGKVGDELYFKGGSPFFTVWNPDELDKMGPDWEGDKIDCAILRREALAKARKR